MNITKITATFEDNSEVVLFPLAPAVVTAPIIEEPVKVAVTDADGHDTTFVPEVTPEVLPEQPAPTA